MSEPSIDIFACPTKTCRCGQPCAVCGNGPHVSLHGPVYGQPAGSPAWDHAYRRSNAARDAGLGEGRCS